MGPARNLLLAVLAAGIWQIAHAQDLTALIQRVTPSVVEISDGAVQQGSGFLVSPGGMIATSLHVVAKLMQPRVTLADGRVFDEVAILGYDADRDLAILTIPQARLRSLLLGSSAKVKVGHRVVAFGAPWGLSGTATSGIVSAIRKHGKVAGATLLQTDAAINPGSSGGPLVDANGRVVGVVTSRIKNAENLGFAVPVDDLRPLLKSRGRLLTLDELRERLVLTDWAPSILPRRWRAEGESPAGTARGALYELDGSDDSIRMRLVRAHSEAHLGPGLLLILVRNGHSYQGESSGELSCETLRESRRLAWRQQNARITGMTLTRIDLIFLAPGSPDPKGSCQLEFQPQTLSLTPASETDVAPVTGEAERLESIRTRRAANEQRRDRLRGDCPQVRAKLARDCVHRSEWNAAGCTNFDDLAAVCSREGF